MHFWRRTALIYRTAEQLKLLDCRLEAELAQFSGQSTILEVIKRNVLFALCKPWRFVAKDVKNLFKFVNARAFELVFNSSELAIDFIWDQDHEGAPVPYNPLRAYNSSALSIHLSPLLNKSEAVFGRDLSAECIQTLNFQLSGHRAVLEATIPATPLSVELVVQTLDIFPYVSNTLAMGRIKQLSALNEKQPKSSGLYLAPLEHSQLIAKKWDEMQPSPQKMVKASVYKTRYEHFLVIALPEMGPLELGQPIVINFNQGVLRLAFIRQVMHSSLNANYDRVLVEVMNATIEFVKGSINEEKFGALLLEYPDASVDLFISHEKSLLGLNVNLSSSHVSADFQIVKALEYYQGFVVYRLQSTRAQNAAQSSNLRA